MRTLRRSRPGSVSARNPSRASIPRQISEGLLVVTVESRVNLAVVYAEQGEGEAAKAELKAAINIGVNTKQSLT